DSDPRAVALPERLGGRSGRTLLLQGLQRRGSPLGVAVRHTRILTQSSTSTDEPPEVATRVRAPPRTWISEPPERFPRRVPLARNSASEPPLACTAASLTDRSRPWSLVPPDIWRSSASARPSTESTDPPEPCRESRPASTPRTRISLPPLASI